MRNVLIALIVVSFLASVAGCTSRSEYNNLLEQKAAVDKKMEQFLSNNVKVKNELAQRESDIRALTARLSEANTTIKELKAQLAETKARIKEFDKKVLEVN